MERNFGNSKIEVQNSILNSMTHGNAISTISLFFANNSRIEPLEYDLNSTSSDMDSHTTLNDNDNEICVTRSRAQVYTK